MVSGWVCGFFDVGAASLSIKGLTASASESSSPPAVTSMWERFFWVALEGPGVLFQSGRRPDACVSIFLSQATCIIIDRVKEGWLTSSHRHSSSYPPTTFASTQQSHHEVLCRSSMMSEDS